MSANREQSTLNLTASSNQVIIGDASFGGTKTTVTCAAPAANRTLTIADCLGDCNVMLGRVSVVDPGVTRAILATESGSVFNVSAAAARVYTLPSVTNNAGVRYRFVIGTGGANTVTIRAATAVLGGQVSYGAGGPTAVTGLNCAASTDLVFAASQVIGAWCEVVCTGTIWSVCGHSTIASGFTVA